MTNQGPATPGTAALDLNKWDTCPCGSPAGPEFRYWLCDPCAELTPASALLCMGQLFGNAALAASKSVPEIERLRAENASLLESLRAAEKDRDGARRTYTDYSARLEAMRAERDSAEQRRDELIAELEQERKWHYGQSDKAAAAEQRAEAAEKALHQVRAVIRETVLGQLDAALHDEERSAPQEGEDGK